MPEVSRREELDSLSRSVTTGYLKRMSLRSEPPVPQVPRNTVSRIRRARRRLQKPPLP